MERFDVPALPQFPRGMNAISTTPAPHWASDLPPRFELPRSLAPPLLAAGKRSGSTIGSGPQARIVLQMRILCPTVGLLGVLAISLSSCAPTELNSADADYSLGSRSDPTEQNREYETRTGGLIPIESSNVSMAGYDESSSVMTVLFDSGGLYEYYDVPAGLWEDFLDAQPSPWSQVGYPDLVQGGYEYRRLSR